MSYTDPLNLVQLLPANRRRYENAQKRRHRAFLAVAVGLGVFFVSAAVRAQEAPGIALPRLTITPSACGQLEEAAEGAPDPARMASAGVPGMWFPESVARLMLCEVRELRIRRRELSLVDSELSLWERNAAIYQEQTALAVEALETYRGIVGAAERRAREAEERADRWSRHPALWFAVGVIATGAIVAVTAYGLNSTR